MFLVYVKQSGSRKIWNPIVSIASGSPEPLASTADLPVEREVTGTSIADIPVEREVAETRIEDMPVEHEAAVVIELVQHSKEAGVIDENVYRSNFQESPSVDNNGKIAGEDGVEADDFGDFQESWEESAVEPSHEISEEVVELNGHSHSDQFRTDLEAAKVRSVIFHIVWALFDKSNFCGLLRMVFMEKFYLFVLMLLNKP